MPKTGKKLGGEETPKLLVKSDPEMVGFNFYLPRSQHIRGSRSNCSKKMKVVEYLLQDQKEICMTGGVFESALIKYRKAK